MQNLHTKKNNNNKKKNGGQTLTHAASRMSHYFPGTQMSPSKGRHVLFSKSIFGEFAAPWKRACLAGGIIMPTWLRGHHCERKSHLPHFLWVLNASHFCHLVILVETERVVIWHCRLILRHGFVKSRLCFQRIQQGLF